VSLFYREMLGYLTKSISNQYLDNFDYEIRSLAGFQRAQYWITSAFARIMRLIGRKATILVLPQTNYFINSISDFEQTYDLLNDEESKAKIIELIAYKALGFTKVKLSLNNDWFHQEREKIKKLECAESISLQHFKRPLHLYDLKKTGYDIKLFHVNNGVFVDFVLEQYKYENLVSVTNGDVVIDAGGCWGDTALYFAHCGADSVYVYEFIPSNIEVMKKNLELNPHLKEKIHLVQSPAWSESNHRLSFCDKGPASQVGKGGVFSDGETSTLSIDDLVRDNQVDKIDFIKMDIEGAEIPALVGAKETIRKFKPKLAISAYHKPDDMIAIPKLLHNLNPGYRFYLDYYTIIGDEVVLYAIDHEDAK